MMVHEQKGDFFTLPIYKITE